jgi:tetratricopeptide (TPR) repeat protein
MAPPSLLAVARKAMSRSTADRYESAIALATDVERWLADEPLAAVRDPLSVRARRWTRRHRLLATSSAAALVVAAVCLAVATGLLSSKNQELHEAVLLAETNEREANASATAAAEAMKLARTREAEALANFLTACDTVNKFTVQVSDNPRLQEQDLELLRKDLLASAVAFYRQLVERRGDDPMLRQKIVDAHVKLGRILEATGQWIEARKEYQRAIVILKADPDQMSRDHFVGENNVYVGLFTVARMLDDPTGSLDAARKALTAREAANGPNPASANDRADAATMQVNLAGTLAKIQGNSPEANAAFDRAFRLIRANLAQDRKNQIFWEAYPTALNEFATMKGLAGQFKLAQEAFTSARNFYRDIAAEAIDANHRLKTNYISTCMLLGSLDHRLGQWTDAESAFAEGAREAAILAAKHPTILHYQHLRAECLMGEGMSATSRRDPATAVPLLREGLDIRLAVHKATPKTDSHRHRLIHCHLMLGAALSDQSKFTEAAEQIRKADALRKPLAVDVPISQKVADAWCHLAMVTKDEAIIRDAFENSLKIAKDLNQPATVKNACIILRQLHDAGLLKDPLRAARLADPEFQSLRGREDFQQLLTELKVKNPSPMP